MISMGLPGMKCMSRNVIVETSQTTNTDWQTRRKAYEVHTRRRTLGSDARGAGSASVGGGAVGTVTGHSFVRVSGYGSQASPC